MPRFRIRNGLGNNIVILVMDITITSQFFSVGSATVSATRRGWELFSLRVVQADYFLTRFNNSLNDLQNNFRIGAGIVFQFRQRPNV
jgi:hypothetical protein